MKLKLIDKRQILGDIKTFTFEAPAGTTWLPGQYFHYNFDHPNPDDRGIERWFTISSPPYRHKPTLTTRISDNRSSFKAALDKLKIGDEIEADAPSGKFVLTDPDRPVIFIAGGIGITPYYSILMQLSHDKRPINVDLMYANRDDNFLFGDELESLTKDNPNFRIHKFISPTKIERNDIKQVASGLDDPDYYISGPESMVEAYSSMLETMGIAQNKIHTDHFSGYEHI